MLTFAYPWLLLLAPLPWLLRKFSPAHREKSLAVRVPFLDILARAGKLSDSNELIRAGRPHSRWVLLVSAWLLVVCALARPQWLEEPLVKELPMRDLLIAVDLSGSMETRDFNNEAGEAIDRLAAVKQVLDQFLARRSGDRAGLILFGSVAFVQAPFTDDLDVVRELLEEAQVRMLGPRTMLGDAMGLAINQFERSEVDDRVLIVLTDGNDTGSLVPPDRAAEIARDNGVVVYTIAIGDPTAVGEQQLDEKTLRNIAATTSGAYFHANDREELEAIYAHLDEINPRQVETQQYRPVTDLFTWPLSIAILLTMFFLAYLEIHSRYASRKYEKLPSAVKAG